MTATVADIHPKSIEGAKRQFVELYGSARSLYAKLHYVEVGRIPDFYRQGDDLITLSRRLDVVAEASLPMPSRAAALLGD